MAALQQHLLVFLAFLNAIMVVYSATNPTDVQALVVLYNSLNKPPQLTGWSASGGDPCGSSWKGITCSGPVVTSLQLSGLGLTGNLGYQLGNFLFLKTMDLSNNNIHDSIPYQLPPNITYLNLARNNISGGIPYSFTTLLSLNYVNLSQNALSQSIIDVFANLQNLADLDLSNNNFSGDLPNSFSALSDLSSLYLQNNQLSGSVDVLSNLALKNLNLANNHFSGMIPQQFSSIPNLMLGGNSFSNSPVPPPPPYTPPPFSQPHEDSGNTATISGSQNRSNGSSSSVEDDERSKRGLSKVSVVGIVIGSAGAATLLAVAAVFLCLRKKQQEKYDSKRHKTDSERSLRIVTDAVVVNKDIQEQRLRSTSSASLKPTVADRVIAEKGHEKIGSGKWPRSPVSATSYTVATLQVATNSFSQDSLVGAGSLGRVYKAELSNGKVLAIKKLDSAALSLNGDEKFLEAVTNLSRLRHPNIVALVGYCAEHGQRLLVYEYISNGTVHDMLHFAEDSSKSLSWNARVRIALGTARALEYLHEVCLPSVVHRNFKSANILLDDDLNPRLSDCGLSSLTANTERQVSAEVMGSFGYSAPEFSMSGVYTVKSDVYSFGVVMLELLTGRKPLDSSRARSEQSLIRWAMPQLHDIDALAKMVDPTLQGMYPVKSLSRFADIIALCIQPEPEFRPPMSEVVQQLVRLVQRSSIVRRGSKDEFGSSYRVIEPEYGTVDISF